MAFEQFVWYTNQESVSESESNVTFDLEDEDDKDKEEKCQQENTD